MLGHEATKAGGILDLGAARERVREISARFGFDVDPDALVEDLPVGVQQRVEIIKALSRDARVLVFDEPTAVLTPQETDELMGIMRQLKESGHLHRLHHPQAARGPRGRRPHHRHPARQGRRRGLARRASNAELASLMVGRAVELTVHKDPAQARTTARSWSRDLTVIDPTRPDRRQRRQLRRARRRDPRRSPASRATARPSSPRRCVGLRAPRPRARSRSTARSSSARACASILDEGVGFVPEDRNEDGLVGAFTIAENLMLDRSNGPPFVRGGSLQARATSPSSPQEKFKEFDVRAQGIDDPGRHALRRQPAEGGARARAEPRPVALRRRPAHPRRRRRLDRVHPQAHRRDAGCRHPGHRRLHRARRGRRRSPTASWSCIAAGSSASCPATPRARCSA